MKPITKILAAASATMMLIPTISAAQQTDSRLYEITKSGKIQVCQYPLYYAISYRNPATGEIEGIDADLAKELAASLGAELEVVESTFAAFVADIQTGKCQIGMFGLGATLKRGQAVAFSDPYLQGSAIMVTRDDGPVKS